MHVVGFDAPGESLELRITARDRSAYVAGALLAADHLRAHRAARPGVTPFDALVRELVDATRCREPTDRPTRAVA